MQTGHQLFVLLFGILACLVLVAFNVRGRLSGKNNEIKEEPWRLRCGAQKVHEHTNETIRTRKLRSNG